jgi:hypothetical protein
MPEEAPAKPSLKRRAAKSLTKFVVSASVGTTVGAIVNNALPVAEKTSTKVRFAIGCVMIGAMAKAAAADFVDPEIDEFFDLLDILLVKAEEADEAEETPAE